MANKLEKILIQRLNHWRKSLQNRKWGFLSPKTWKQNGANSIPFYTNADKFSVLPVLCPR